MGVRRHWKKATIADLTELGERVILLAQEYKIRKRGEMFYDALLFSMLSVAYPSVERQHPLKKRPGQKRSQRIDFRLGGANPVVVELACRSRRSFLHPSGNRSELQKLTRQRRAKTRFLLLLDPSRFPALTQTRLIDSYRSWNPGSGRFERLPVRVLYVRPGHSFDFVWRARRRSAV